jgi:hypothetical protein
VLLCGCISRNQNALGALAQMAEMGDFFSILDVQAYQATQQVAE